jgi:hypothetical protein
MQSDWLHEDVLIMFCINSFFKQYQVDNFAPRNYNTPIFGGCNGVSLFACALSKLHNGLFWLFTQPFEWNHVSSENRVVQYSNLVTKSSNQRQSLSASPVGRNSRIIWTRYAGNLSSFVALCALSSDMYLCWDSFLSDLDGGYRKLSLLSSSVSSIRT